MCGYRPTAAQDGCSWSKDALKDLIFCITVIISSGGILVQGVVQPYGGTYQVRIGQLEVKARIQKQIHIENGRIL